MHGSALYAGISSTGYQILQAVNRWQYQSVKFIMGKPASCTFVPYDASTVQTTKLDYVAQVTRLSDGIPKVFIKLEFPLTTLPESTLTDELQDLAGCEYIHTSKQRPDEIWAQLDLLQSSGGAGNIGTMDGSEAHIRLLPLKNGRLDLVEVRRDSQLYGMFRTDFEQPLYTLTKDGKRALSQFLKSKRLDLNVSQEKRKADISERPSRVRAAAVYHWAMSNILDAEEMAWRDLFNAIQTHASVTSEMIEMLPDNADTFAKYCRDSHIKHRATLTKKAPGKSIVRRDQI